VLDASRTAQAARHQFEASALGMDVANGSG
jgi:hypothetical protein